MLLSLHVRIRNGPTHLALLIQVTHSSRSSADFAKKTHPLLAESSSYATEKEVYIHLKITLTPRVFTRQCLATFIATSYNASEQNLPRRLLLAYRDSLRGEVDRRALYRFPSRKRTKSCGRDNTIASGRAFLSRRIFAGSPVG